MNFTLLFILLFIGSNISKAQFTQEWLSTYNWGEVDESYAMTYSNGFIYIAGYIGGPFIDLGVVVLKYNKYGNIIWNYTNTNIGYGVPQKILLDNSGNVYVTGYYDTTGGNKYDYLTFKLDSAGNLKWMSRYSYDTLSLDYSKSMCLDNMGNVYVTGTSGNVGPDVATIKYDSLGKEIWVARFTSTPYAMDDIGVDIKIDKKGYIYIAAQCSGYGTNSDAVLLKYDNEGYLKWYRRYNDNTMNAGDFFDKMDIDDSSNIHLVGYSSSYGLMMIYNENGDLLKFTRDKPSNVSNLYLTDCKLDKWNNLYAAGKCDYIGGSEDICVVKYNQQGNILWTRTYDGGFSLDDYSRGLDVDKYGNCYVVGSCKIAQPFYVIMKTLAYDKNGNLSWEASYSGEIKVCHAGEITIDTANSIYVTGSSQNNISNTGLDIVLIKYSSLVSINPGINTVPLNFELKQNYPNPFNPTTKIQFTIPKNGFISIKVFDVLGKEIRTLVNEAKNAGNYSVDFDGSQLPSGVYFYRLTTDGFSQTKKLLLIK